MKIFKRKERSRKPETVIVSEPEAQRELSIEEIGHASRLIATLLMHYEESGNLTVDRAFDCYSEDHALLDDARQQFTADLSVVCHLRMIKVLDGQIIPWNLTKDEIC